MSLPVLQHCMPHIGDLVKLRLSTSDSVHCTRLSAVPQEHHPPPPLVSAGNTGSPGRSASGSPALHRQSATTGPRRPRGSGEPAVLVAPGSSEGDLLQPQHAGLHGAETTSIAPVAPKAPVHAGTAVNTASAASLNVPNLTKAGSALERLTALAHGTPSTAPQPYATTAGVVETTADMGSGMPVAHKTPGLVARKSHSAGPSGVDAILASAAALSELAGLSADKLAASEHQCAPGQLIPALPVHATHPLSSTAAAEAIGQSNMVSNHNSSRKAPLSSTVLSYSAHPVMQPTTASHAYAANGSPHTLSMQASHDRGHMNAAAAGQRQPAGTVNEQQQESKRQAADSSVLRGFRPELLGVGTRASTPSTATLGQSVDFSKVNLPVTLTSVRDCSFAQLHKWLTYIATSDSMHHEASPGRSASCCCRWFCSCIRPAVCRLCNSALQQSTMLLSCRRYNTVNSSRLHGPVLGNNSQKSSTTHC